MAAARARVEVAALQALLTGLGVLMALASRRVDRFRRQVTRDLLLEVRSDDGARRQYRLHAATRRPRRPAPVPIRSPERNAPWARRIIREPAVRELSRDWPEAWAARGKLLQLRAAAGERLPPG